MRKMNAAASAALAAILAALLAASAPCAAAEEAPAAQGAGTEGEDGSDPAAQKKPDVGYFTIQPDFVTSLASPNPADRLHYVRIRVCLMMGNDKDRQVVAGMEPAIKDAVMTVLGSKEFTQVASPEGREKIRVECRDKIMSLMQAKVGAAVV
ncbi:MAG: flagellar basal body-associated FliL family protein, partial [Succinivibrio sp.]